MKLNAIIEKGQDGGFAVCVREMPWLMGYGQTVEEAKADFCEVFKEQVEYYNERNGKCPEWAEAEISFSYDIAAFFTAFPFINVSQFAQFVGINPSLMRKYKQGLATASEKQLSIIQNGIHQMIKHLQLVQF